MMRYALLIAATILVACTVPPGEQKPIPVSPAIDVTAPRETPKPKEHKPHAPKATPAPPAIATHPCAGIATGDHETDVRAKLECLEEHG